MLLQLLGSGLFLIDMPYQDNGHLFLNTSYLGIFFISIAALLSAYLLSLDTQAKHTKYRLDLIFLIMALSWWYIGGLEQILHHVNTTIELSATIIFLSISAALLSAFGLSFNWRLVSFSPWLLVAPLWFLLPMGLDQIHLFSRYGFVAWPLALAVSVSVLYYSDRLRYDLIEASGLHIMAYLLLVTVLSIVLSTSISRTPFTNDWAAIAILAPIVTGLALLLHWQKWPISKHPAAYQKVGQVIIIAIVAWSLGLNLLPFLNPTPLPYIPLLNPLDTAQIFALWVLFNYWKKFYSPEISPDEKLVHIALFSGFCFLWFNAMLFKTVHVYSGLAYTAKILFESSLVQMLLSVSWSLIALSAMVVASRLHQRRIWLVGASLASIVVAKLFLLDLSGQETVERIISFLAVGVLLLLVGYFSPVPPRQHKETV